ncbi:MAG: hypothetical protein MI921_25910 [Cytophagales bacterium]|nr:hypothetical protein [Cytophagales bacterium]
MLFTVACSNKKSARDHGHEHGTEEHDHVHDKGAEGHGHDESDHHEQEEFTVSGDSTKIDADSTHSHEDGSTHHNH